MASKNFMKDNFALIVGLALPVVLMLGFLVASTSPSLFAKPPAYDMVFATDYYDVNNGEMVASGDDNEPRLSLRFVVGDDGLLRARYKRLKKNEYASGLKKLYIYEAKSGRVRPLAFTPLKDAAAVADIKEEVVPSAEAFKLDTAELSPDGYQLIYGSTSDTGLLGEFFGNSGSRVTMPRLQKGHASTLLLPQQGQVVDYYSAPEFIGWVVGSRS